MTKQLLKYGVICGVFLIITFPLHYLIIKFQNIQHPFDLWKVYLFLVIITLLILISFELIVSKLPNMSDQIGFLYLGSMVFKIAAFCMAFNSILFSDIVLSMADRLSLLIPVLIFLVLEVFFVTKILKRISK